MKLVDLFEKLTAPVHINDNKKLYVIAGLIEKEFGLNFRKIEGSCLAAQMIYSMSAVSGIDPKKLIDVINKSPLRANFNGVTIEQMFNVFNDKVLIIDNNKVKFKLSIETPEIEKAISEVKSGQPVIFIPNKFILSVFNDEASFYKTGGIADFDSLSDSSMKFHVKDNINFHAFLLIGYDDNGYLIFRDTRHEYLFKGYVKAKYDRLAKYPTGYKFITVIVDDCKIEKA